MDAQLTEKFRRRVEEAGLSQSGVARAVGVSRQQFNRIWRGLEAPSTRFMALAVDAGYGKTFADIAEPVTNDTKEKTAA